MNSSANSFSPFLLPGFKEEFHDPYSEDFYINMGPQHPSTHGALRLQIRLDGESVIEIVPHFGYIHRGLEKQAESQNYVQYIHLSDRQDYLTAIQNNLGVCLALEKGMGIGVPERGEYIRVMMAELGRIASHLVFYGCFGGDLGGQTPLIYGFKEREMIHDILDQETGSRLTTNFFRPGGSRFDVTDAFLPRQGVSRTLEAHDGRLRKASFDEPHRSRAFQGSRRSFQGRRDFLWLFGSRGALPAFATTFARTIPTASTTPLTSKSLCVPKATATRVTLCASRKFTSR